MIAEHVAQLQQLKDDNAQLAKSETEAREVEHLRSEQDEPNRLRADMERLRDERTALE